MTEELSAEQKFDQLFGLGPQSLVSAADPGIVEIVVAKKEVI